MNTIEAIQHLSKQNLENWLSQKDESEFIGYEHLSGQCPIACFFKEQFEVAVNVGNPFSLSTFTVIGDTPVDLPEWARSFAEEVDQGDASEEVGTDDEGNTVYRPQAGKLKELLKAIETPTYLPPTIDKQPESFGKGKPRY